MFRPFNRSDALKSLLIETRTAAKTWRKNVNNKMQVNVAEHTACSLLHLRIHIACDDYDLYWLLRTWNHQRLQTTLSMFLFSRDIIIHFAYCFILVYLNQVNIFALSVLSNRLIMINCIKHKSLNIVYISLYTV